MKKAFLFVSFLAISLLTSCEVKPSSSNSYDSSVSGSTTSSGSSSVSSSSSDSSSSSSQEPVENTIYFNLTEYGRYDGVAGSEISSMGLTYGKSYTALTGTLLPGADVVTNTRGYEFGGWVTQSNSGGGLIKITTMPGVANMILQAWWLEETSSSSSSSSSSSESSSSSQSSSEETTLGDLYLSVDGAYTLQMTEGYSSVLSATEWIYTGIFTAGFEFSLRSQNGLLGESTSKQYPYATTAKPQPGYTLAAGGDGNLTANYLQANGTFAESGVSTDGTWCKYAANATAGSLEFKTAGTYNLYVTIWDSGAWVRIYVTPVV